MQPPRTRIVVATAVIAAFATGVSTTAQAATPNSVAAITATGYLTPASAGDFARALRQQIAADVTAGRRPGSSPLFGGLVSMASATAAPAPVTPQYALNILPINTLDDSGAPDSALLLVVDQDNSKAFQADLASADGVAKVAVPAGHRYTVLMGNFVFNDQGYVTREELVSTTDVPVPDHAAVPPGPPCTTAPPSTAGGSWAARARRALSWLES